MVLSTAALTASVCLLVMQRVAPVSAATADTAGRVAGKPNFSGIWEANNTANWDLQTHEARPMVAQPGFTPNSVVLAAPVLGLGAIGWVPPGLGVVEGDEIPYLPWAAARKTENLEHWMDRDPEIKCFEPGVPRAMYMPYPFQIIQSNKDIMMVFEFANAQRTIHLTKMDPYPNTAYMGYSAGKWEGDTLVVEAEDFTDATWFDRSGNFHSDALHVTERYTPMGRDAITTKPPSGPAGFHAAVENQHAALSPAGTERAIDGFPVCGDGGRDHVRAPSQEPAGKALGRQHHERGHHAQDSAGRGRL